MNNFTNIYSSRGSQIFPRAGLVLKAGTIIQKNKVFETLTKPAMVHGTKTTILGDGQGRDKKEIVFSIVEIV
tara:strand:+ start:634 stop:849 length:216 start_codon:yes stop_codon:yes gene_type:complete